VSGLLIAARYLTIVPLPGRATPGLTGLGRAAAWFPIVGLLLGVALAGVDAVLARVFPGLLAALLTVTAWKVLTGGLHLDGLADCLDGLGGRDPDHRRVIMSDSRIGTFGAVGLILFLMLEIVCLSGMEPWPRRHALLLAPVVGRATAPLLARLFPAARAHGHGAAFVAEVTRRAAWTAVLVALVVGLAALGAAGLAATVLGLGAATLAARFLVARLGGVTGDVFGAAVEGAELVVLLTVAGWTGARP
jgi:adenosylcobinamide-GDP ribazoletransferase